MTHTQAPISAMLDPQDRIFPVYRLLCITPPTKRPADKFSNQDPATNVQTNRMSTTTRQKSCSDTVQLPTLPPVTIYPFTAQTTQGKRANASCSCLSGAGLPTPVSTYFLYIRRCCSTLCATKTITAQSPLCPDCIYTPNRLRANAK